MSRTDLIADGFTMIRNAIMAHKENVDIPASNTLKSIMEIFKNSEYIDTYKLIEDKKQGVLRVYLKYRAGRSAIIGLKRISTPGSRLYKSAKKLPKVLRGKGLAVVSTSHGVMTDKDAREKSLGGEILAYIW